MTNSKGLKRDFSPLMYHARRELELLGEDSDIIDWMVSVVEKFVEFGHSGASAEFLSFQLYNLLQFKNLTPLTTNQKEWTDRSFITGHPLWQSARNPQAFSEDGGLTHYFLDDGKTPHDIFDTVEYLGENNG